MLVVNSCAIWGSYVQVNQPNDFMKRAREIAMVESSALTGRQVHLSSIQVFHQAFRAHATVFPEQLSRGLAHKTMRQVLCANRKFTQYLRYLLLFFFFFFVIYHASILTLLMYTFISSSYEKMLVYDLKF